MKDWNKIFRIIATLVICLSVFYVYFLFSVKTVLESKLQQLTGRKTTVEKLNIRPPLNIEIKGLKIEGMAKVGYIYLSPSIPSFMVGRIAFNKIKIVEPEITFLHAPIPAEKSQSGQALSTPPPVTLTSAAPTPVAAPSTPARANDKNFPFFVKSLKVYSGKINFTDTTGSKGKINFLIKDIRLYITNLPSNGVSNFSLKGNISWFTGEPDGKVFLQGWANFAKKDMLATLRIENIDAIVFYPYYSNWVDLEKARIEKAKLNFNSTIKGKDNDIEAASHLELVDIVRKVRPPDEPQQKAEKLTDAVLDMFKNMNQGKVVLDFTLHTKMDNPQFGFGNIKSAFEGKLMQGRANAGLRPQDMLLWPVKLVQGGVKSASDISNAAAEGLFSLGNGIKKFFEDIINKSDNQGN